MKTRTEKRCEATRFENMHPEAASHVVLKNRTAPALLDTATDSNSKVVSNLKSDDNSNIALNKLIVIRKGKRAKDPLVGGYVVYEEATGKFLKFFANLPAAEMYIQKALNQKELRVGDVLFSEETLNTVRENLPEFLNTLEKIKTHTKNYPSSGEAIREKLLTSYSPEKENLDDADAIAHALISEIVKDNLKSNAKRETAEAPLAPIRHLKLV